MQDGCNIGHKTGFNIIYKHHCKNSHNTRCNTGVTLGSNIDAKKDIKQDATLGANLNVKYNIKRDKTLGTNMDTKKYVRQDAN